MPHRAAPCLEARTLNMTLQRSMGSLLSIGWFWGWEHLILESEVTCNGSYFYFTDFKVKTVLFIVYFRLHLHVYVLPRHDLQLHTTNLCIGSSTALHCLSTLIYTPTILP